LGGACCGSPPHVILIDADIPDVNSAVLASGSNPRQVCPALG
jgi:hypothetical protein